MATTTLLCSCLIKAAIPAIKKFYTLIPQQNSTKNSFPQNQNVTLSLEKDLETVREEHIVKKGLTNITAPPFLGLLQLLSDEIMKSPVLGGYINLHI